MEEAEGKCVFFASEINLVWLLNWLKLCSPEPNAP